MINIESLLSTLQSAAADLPNDASRLFHGRGHTFPGLEFLNVDWFDPVLWVVVYGEVEERLVDALRNGLIKLAVEHPQIECIALQRRGRGQASCDLLYGKLPSQALARESGASYQLSFGSNQNIGFFLDARPGRDWIRQQARGRRVLNLFAYTCSFSVAALQGGAEQVVNIDMAKSAIATGQRNHALNVLDQSRVRFLPHDVFRSIRKLESLGPYDLVVIDPPSRQRGSFEADRDYGRLLTRLGPMLAPGAQILACLNAPYLDAEFLPALFAEHLPAYRLQQRLPQRQDFPEQDADRCLKMQIFSA